MTRIQSRMTVLLVAIFTILCMMIAGTSYSHASNIVTLENGEFTKMTYEDVENTDYFKFKATTTGSAIISTEEFFYDTYNAYVKVDGKYKKIAHSYAIFYVTKGKTYYVKLKGIQRIDSDAIDKVGIGFDTMKEMDGGSKKAKAKTIKFNKNPFVYIGHHTYYDGSVDWYKFKLTKTKSFNIQFYPWAVNTVKADTLTLYKGKKKIDSKKLSAKEGKSIIKEYKNLKPGTYYIKIKRGSKLNNYGYGISLNKKGYKWRLSYEDDIDHPWKQIKY